MAKNPIKQVKLPNDSTTYDVQDNTLVGGYGINLHTESDGSRTLSANMPWIQCSTPTGTTNKIVSGVRNVSGITLDTNPKLIIYFTDSETLASTLNVNSTGAKPLYVNGSAISSSNSILSASYYFVYYNNSYWDMELINTKKIDANPSGTATVTLSKISIDGTIYKVGEFAYPVAVCNSSESSTAKTATLPGFQLVSGAGIMINFTRYNTASSFTLNVNSTGAKNVSGPYPLNKMKNGLYYASYSGSIWNLTYIHNTSSHRYHHILDISINNTTTFSKELRLRLHYWSYNLEKVTSNNVNTAGFNYITSAIVGGDYILDGMSYWTYSTSCLCPIVKLVEREYYDEDAGETIYYLDVSYTRSTTTSVFTFKDSFGDSGVTLNDHLIFD